jgi:DNA repair protein RadC
MTEEHTPQLPLALDSDRFANIRAEDLTQVETASVVRLALEVTAQRHRRGAVLGSPRDTAAYLRLALADRPNEVFVGVLLDNRHRVIAVEELFHGTIDGASVHPRVVVQKALANNAAAVIFAHNHPSGVAEPSQSDIRITQHLKSALALVDVRVLDHFVVAAEGDVSLAERALL